MATAQLTGGIGRIERTIPKRKSEIGSSGAASSNKRLRHSARHPQVHTSAETELRGHQLGDHPPTSGRPRSRWRYVSSRSTKRERSVRAEARPGVLTLSHDTGHNGCEQAVDEVDAIF